MNGIAEHTEIKMETGTGSVYINMQVKKEFDGMRVKRKSTGFCTMLNFFVADAWTELVGYVSLIGIPTLCARFVSSAQCSFVWVACQISQMSERSDM